MSSKLLSYLTAAALVSIAFAAQGHNPQEHIKRAEKPNCSTIDGMGAREIAGDDSVMQAMMLQCRKVLTHDAKETAAVSDKSVNQEVDIADNKSAKTQH